MVVPLSSRATLTPDEQISLRHATHYLGRYDRYLVAPSSLRFAPPAGYRVKRFPDRFFGSAIAHGRLTTSAKFYESFREYQYILMYQLDALVFSDQLLEWCATDLDYIGAPWLNCPDSPWVTRDRVGNGGFALLKIESMLKVLHSRRLADNPDAYWQHVCATKTKLSRWLRFPRKHLEYSHWFNGVQRRARGFELNVDLFWADEARHFYPEFKIASMEMGLRFAFEAAPRVCFERNHRQLPFGCHAWPKYDRAFWEPHLLPGLPTAVKVLESSGTPK